MPFTSSSDLKVFSGSSNPLLAQKIVEYIGTRLGDCELSKFANGEINVKINETVRGYDVYVIQSLSEPVNDHLMEVLIMIDALKRASAGSICVILPQYAYARQDRKARGRDPISAKLLANILTVAGANRVVTIDLHADQIQGFFEIPVDNLSSFPVFANYFLDNPDVNLDEYSVVSPDVGGVKRARKFAEKLGTPFAILDKRRPKDNVAEIMSVIGDVRDKKCIIFDDLIDTGGTLIEATNALMANGAKEVTVCATHGLLSRDAKEKLQNSNISKIILTDTIYHKDLPDKFDVLTVSQLFGEAVVRIRKNLSISILFK